MPGAWCPRPPALPLAPIPTLSSLPAVLLQIDAVNQVLEELGVGNLPTLHVWNKVGSALLLSLSLERVLRFC